MGIAAKALEWSRTKLGSGYDQNRRNNTNPDIFDCSSLVARAFGANGYTMKQTTSMYEVDDPGFDLLWPLSRAQTGKSFGTLAQLKAAGWTPAPGDLMFFCQNHATTRANKITHVAFVNNPGEILHARNPQKGVCVDKITLYDGTICAVTRFNEARFAKTPEASGFVVSRLLKLPEGEDVRALQNELIARDYDCGPNGAMGIFDSCTEFAVRRFQADKKLTADGKAGEKTIIALGGIWKT